MKNHIITEGPSIDQIMKAIKEQKVLLFIIDYGWGFVEEKVIPLGIEKVIDKKGNYYNICVKFTTKSLPHISESGRHHFVFQPQNNCWGRWVGTFKQDHSAYEGHSL